MERCAIFTRFDTADGWSPRQESKGCSFLGTAPWLSNCLVLLSDNPNLFTNHAGKYCFSWAFGKLGKGFIL